MIVYEAEDGSNPGWGICCNVISGRYPFFLLPVQRFSELENRYLQKAPHLTWDNLLSHTYAEEAESFVTDHFPFRAKWVWVKSAVEQMRLQQENNGI